MDLLSGVVVFVLGVFLFMTPSIVIKLLPWMLSAFVLVDSLWKFKGAFLLKKGGNGAWSVLLIGSLVFIALGIVMLFGRFPKIMTLLIFSGWVLVCDGAADIIFFIIIFIFGHLLNLAINALGAYVHSARLQYVEFFGKYYEGGGIKFAPLEIKTEYVKVTEEK